MLTFPLVLSVLLTDGLLFSQELKAETKYSKLLSKQVLLKQNQWMKENSV
jgi:hypothetical protein